MPFLPTEAFPVDFLPDGRIRALADVVWTGSRGDSVTIAKGRVSDLGTVPKLLRGVLPHDGAAARAFLVHDELCERLHEYQRALDAYAHRVNVLPGSQWGPKPEAPTFSAVDTDAVMRVILAELGVGPVRWIYWEGVRAGALGSQERRRGFGRTLLPFVLLAPVALVTVLPAALGGAISWALLALWALACSPWEARARRERARTVDRVRAVARGREAIARGRKSGESAARTENGEARRAAAIELGDYIDCGALIAPLDPGPCHDCRNGCPVIGGPCTPDDAHDVVMALDRDNDPCPPGTHSNTGTAADEEIAACPNCNPRSTT